MDNSDTMIYLKAKKSEMEMLYTPPSIAVIGIGASGINAVQTMIQSGIKDFIFICADTDAQRLATSNASIKLHVCENISKTSGVMQHHDQDAELTEKNISQLTNALLNRTLVFIIGELSEDSNTARMIAQIAYDMKIHTIVSIVTLPPKNEQSLLQATYKNIKDLINNVNSLIVLPHEDLMKLENSNSSSNDNLTYKIIADSVTAFSDILTDHGVINIDFSDMKEVFKNSTKLAMLGIGSAKGSNRASEATKKAIESSVLNRPYISGAKALLVNVTTDNSLTMDEFANINDIIDKASQQNGIEPEIFIGTTIDESLGDTLRVAIIATGLDEIGEFDPKKILG